MKLDARLAIRSYLTTMPISGFDISVDGLSIPSDERERPTGITRINYSGLLMSRGVKRFTLPTITFTEHPPKELHNQIAGILTHLYARRFLRVLRLITFCKQNMTTLSRRIGVIPPNYKEWLTRRCPSCLTSNFRDYLGATVGLSPDPIRS